MCIYCVYIHYLYINALTCMYIFQKNMFCLYMKYIYKLYKYIYVNTCKYFQNIYCMCVYLYIDNEYTHSIYTYIMQSKTFILDAINRTNSNKNTNILNCNNISQYYCFTVFFFK